MTNPGSEPPAMDATTAETPTLEELNEAVTWAAESAMFHSDSARRPGVLSWLASHLPALMADKARMEWVQAHGERVEWVDPDSDAGCCMLAYSLNGEDGRDIFEAAGSTFGEAIDAARLAQGERTR